MIAELFDKLSILIIRVIVLKADSSDKLLIKNINKELKKIFLKKNIDKKYIFYLNLLVQVNYQIWMLKEKMYKKNSKFKENELKFSHQINSIRNILKNKLQKLHRTNNDLIKSNVDKEDLKGWDLILLSSKKLNFKKKFTKNFNFAEYLDELSILQIKEKKFYDKKSRRLLLFHLNNFNSAHVVKNYKVFYITAFLSVINNYVWDIKDEIIKNKTIYHLGLSKAQNLNSLRNELKNFLNETYNQKLNYKTGIFYDSTFYEKVITIRDCFELDNFKKKNEKFKYISLQQIKDLILLKNEKLDPEAENIYKPNNFIYVSTNDYREQIIKEVIEKIINKNFWISGKNKINIWQKGWSENLKHFSKHKNSKNLIPKFLSKKLPLRLQNQWVKPLKKDFEFNLVEIYRTHLFKKYFKNFQNIYEFGSGSAQHLIRLTEIFPHKKIIGLDWSDASIKIIHKLKKEKKLNLEGHKFNLFKPNNKFKIKKNSAIFTVGTMEQLGSNYKNFYNYIMLKKPDLVLHLETIEELYDQNKLFDYLAKIYDKERNYLNGYLTFLRKKESEKKIKIIRIKKFNFGSMMHDSYSSIIWKPL